MDDGKVYVRLKPYNARMGFVVQRYHFDNQLYATNNETGRPLWYKMSATKAARLTDLRQDFYDPLSPDLFDLCTEKEYQAAVAHEDQLRLVELGLMSQQAAGLMKTRPAVDLTPQEVQPGGASEASGGRGAAVPDAAAAPEPAPEPEPDPDEVVEQIPETPPAARARASVAANIRARGTKKKAAGRKARG